jgi:acetyltransferase
VTRLDPLFAPRGIAVVGASRNPAKLGAVMARSLRGFPGTVVGVNDRDVDPAAGRYPGVAEAAASAGPIDLAVLCVPAAVSAHALADAAAGGVRAALVCSGGFAEAGGAGVGYQQDLLAAAAEAGVVLLGPNTSGFLEPGRGLTATFVPGAGAVPAGPVAVVAASGGVNHALAFLLADAGLGVSLAVGLGNAADVDAAVVLDDERALVDAVTALSALRLPPAADPAVGVVTAQAGPGLLHVDGLRGRGVPVPAFAAATRERLAELLPPLTFQANPVDTGRPGPGFGAVLAAVAADPGIDLVSAYALSEPDALDLPAAVDPGAGPLVVGLGGPPEQVQPQRQALRDLGVPSLGSPSALTTAVVALVDDARAQARAGTGSTRSPVAVELPPGELDEDQAKTLLGRLGVATPPRRACADRAAAHRALAELPGPLAVKLLDAQVTHKSDVGGVHLGIRDATELDAALDALEGIGARRFLLESMAPAGIDLLVGASRDPVFGPVVLLGLGGVVAEALADVAVAPATIGPAEAGALADDLAGRALLDGFRGGPVADRSALGAVLVALGGLLLCRPEIDAVEVNPLRVTTDGLVALDAVLTLREEPHDG